MRLKTIVFGVVERAGKIQTYVVDRATRKELEPHITKHVVEGATISTDEARVYSFLSTKYNHGTVYHEAEQWVDGVHHTNTIECFWSHFKCSVKGTHRAISRKHMVKYLGEFEFRFNLRNQSSQQMLDRLELLSNLVYGVNDSSGFFPADRSLIDTVDKLDAGNDVGELLEAA